VTTKARKLDSVESIIASMLKENTGTHFLDSGGAYGRHWQSNQTKDFSKEPACQVTADEYGIEIDFNVYHYLTAYLDHDEVCQHLESKLDKFAELPENADKCWLELMEDFADQFTSYGTTNTYNYDNLLSQVLQYTMFSLTDDEYDVYILLQIHGGCDVRGGYTKPRIFRVTERDYFIIAQSDVWARCDKCNHSWDSDDCGYHWYVGEPSNPEPIPDNQGTMLLDQVEVKPIKHDWSEVKVVDKKVVCPCGGTIDFMVKESY